MPRVEDYNLEPDPRVLLMLGEINLPQPKCLAELIDNAVDGFLTATREGSPIEQPVISVTVPTIDDSSARVTVLDNGPGMSPEVLGNAVRAGWTGNDPINNLGLFGMGFNIATARLGLVTTVWTTRAGDEEWCGIRIDLEQLMRQRSFRTSPLSRQKVDALQHGTEIIIERLKPEQRAWLAKPANKSKIVNELSRIYSSMLQPGGTPIHVELTLNGNAVRGRYHCIWGGPGNTSREVPSRWGPFNAFQLIDRHLGARKYCLSCWHWLPPHEDVCPACGSSEHVIERQRRVYGWLGIQRYAHEQDYGIDFIRHGRKIEVASKDLFQWTDDNSVVTHEYPIDDPRGRGRIVGEIHLDHCRVTYTKDRFERTDPAWDEMIKTVRGDGPLLPEMASQRGFGGNASPLYRMFQVFRRNNPHNKVASAYSSLLAVSENDKAYEYALRFYRGENEYQTDEKWWELIEEKERSLLRTPAPQPGTRPPIPGIGGGAQAPSGNTGPSTPGGVDGAGQSGGRGTTPPGPAPAPPPPPRRTELPSLSGEYRDRVSNVRNDVKAFEVEANDPVLGAPARPWAIRTVSSTGGIEFYVNLRHVIFRSVTMTPLDALLSELTYRTVTFVSSQPNPPSHADIMAALRSQYGGRNDLDPTSLCGDATATLTAIAEGLGRNLDQEDSRALFRELPAVEQEAIQQNMAVRLIPNPQQVINEGRFLEYARGKTLVDFFSHHPELFFDGRYWDDEYSTLDYGTTSATEEAQSRLVRYYSGLLADAVWLAEQSASDIAQSRRERVLRAAMSLELLAAGTREE